MTAIADKIVTFRLGDDLFAADIFAVERVLRWQQPTVVPDMPPWIVGVIDYQSRVVPVIDLRRRFEMPTRELRPETRLIVFHAGTEWVAAVVDSVVEVTGLDTSKLAPPPAIFRGLAGEYLKGLVRAGDHLVVMLDAERLLSSSERLTLKSASDTLEAAHG